MPAGDVDYERHGLGYAAVRRADPRIAARVWRALGPARSVVNVGAGGGSYEPPLPVRVLAVEPAASMRAQRPAGAAPCVAGVAEALPLRTGSVDAAMAVATVHQWPDLRRGLAELRRVARGPVVVLTFDPDVIGDIWLCDYVPSLSEVDRRRMPSLSSIAEGLGGARVEAVPVPLDCTDGFVEAFYGRPEAFLDPAVRRAQSSWTFMDPADVSAGLARLADDLASGAWDARYGHLRTQETYDGPVRLVIAEPADA